MDETMTLPIEGTNIPVEEQPIEEQKAYELRAFEAPDVFKMVKIISLIGIKEFKQAFQNDELANIISNMKSNDADGSNMVVSIGVSVAFDIAGIIMSNLERCENDIYAFLASLSGMTVQQVKAFPAVTFLEMIIDVIMKEEFKDFMKVVSKLLK